MNKLIDAIENNKEQLNSGAYRELMEAAADLHKQIQPTYVIEVFFSRPVIDPKDHIIRSETLRVEFRQPTLGKISYEDFLQHVEGCYIARISGKFVNMDKDDFTENYLTPENQAILMQMSSVVFSSTLEDKIYIDSASSTIMFRVQKLSEPELVIEEPVANQI